MRFTIRLAEREIEIESIFAYIHMMCRDFLVPEVAEPAFRVAVTKEEIFAELATEDTGMPDQPLCDDDYAYLESLAIYRRIAEEMLTFDTYLMHGSVLSVGEEAVMFTATSGTGKTTHSNLWKKRFSDVGFLNGDKPLLMVKDDTAYACGTPWAGKERLYENRILPLRAIVILERGEQNEIHRICYEEAFRSLYAQTYLSEDEEKMIHTLDLIDRMAEHVAFYRLTCNMDPEAAEVARRGIFGQKEGLE